MDFGAGTGDVVLTARLVYEMESYGVELSAFTARKASSMMMTVLNKLGYESDSGVCPPIINMKITEVCAWWYARLQFEPPHTILATLTDMAHLPI